MLIISKLKPAVNQPCIRKDSYNNSISRWNRFFHSSLAPLFAAKSFKNSFVYPSQHPYLWSGLLLLIE